MSADPRLFLWPKLPKDSPKILAVKGIVEELVPKLGYKVKPFWYDVATSEEPKRVLVLADGFENAKLTREAVEWALGLRESRGAKTAMDTMRRICGEDLTMRIETKEDEHEAGDEWG